MLFAPTETQKAAQKGQEELADYRAKLHALAMSDSQDTDPLAKDKELDLLIFEGIVMGHLDGNSPTVIKTVEHVHKRMGKIEEKEAKKKTQ